MKLLKCLLLTAVLAALLAVAAAEGPVALNETNFPDPNFRTLLAPYDTDGDQALSEQEISQITSMNCSVKSIASLQGIEFLTALTSLSCSNNQLTALDVSQNTALTALSCYSNALTALDLSKNTALTTLSCGYNQLTALDVSKNTSLTQLECGNNRLTALDLSKNTALVTLDCEFNQLTALDVLQNTALETLNSYANELATLDLSKNAALTALYCGGNHQMTALDLSQNAALTTLFCEDNRLTALDLSKNTALETLDCYGNQLTALDVSKNAALAHLNCQYNLLTALDLSKNAALTSLYCHNNQLTALDLSKNAALTELSCGENQLTALDVSKNTALVRLDCYYNLLTVLDVSKNTSLNWLSCYGNQLTALDLFFNINIRHYSLAWNEREVIVAGAVIDWSGWPGFDPSRVTILSGGTLMDGVLRPNIGAEQIEYLYFCGRIDSSSNPLYLEVTLRLTYPTELPLDAAHFPDTCFREIVRGFDQDNSGGLSEQEISQITGMRCWSGNIASLQGIEFLTALTTLDCDNNQLTTLDVSKNTALTALYCNNNQLTTLDVSKNTALVTLDCGGNQLTALDLSKNTRLEEYDLSGNTREVIVTGEGVDSSAWPGFEPARVSDLENATLSGGKLIPTPGAESISYVYDCGRGGATLPCTLNLTSVVPEGTMALPGDLRRIGSEAFADVQARAFVLPGSIQSIAPDAFPADAVLYFPRGSTTGATLRGVAGLPVCLPYSG